MALENKTLEDINAGGTLTNIRLGGTTQDKELLIQSAILALIDAGVLSANSYTDGKFGNYTFDGDLLQANGDTLIEADAAGITIGEDFPSTLINKLILSSSCLLYTSDAADE